MPTERSETFRCPNCGGEVTMIYDSGWTRLGFVCETCKLRGEFKDTRKVVLLEA